MLVELSAKIEIAHSRGVEDTDALENASEVVSQLNQTKTKASKGMITKTSIDYRMGIIKNSSITTE